MCSYCLLFLPHFVVVVVVVPLACVDIVAAVV